MKRVSLLLVALALLALALLAPVAFGQEKQQKTKPAAKGAEQMLIDLEQKWVDAFQNKDAVAIEQIEAPGYVFVNAKGQITGKAEDVADAKNGAYEAQFRLENLKVHLFGDTAVVTGQNVIKGKYKGEDVTGTYAFVDTWIKRGGQWQAAASGGTKMQ